MAADNPTVTLPDDGSVVQVTTTDPTQTAYATFNVARGQHLILFCDTTSDDGLPAAKVVDSTGKRVPMPGGIGCFRHVMPTPAIEVEAVAADGPLTLVLPPYRGKAFSVKLSYRVFDDVRTTAALDGGPVTFTPTVKGQDAYVTFQGKSGDRVYAECTSSLPDRGVTGWLLDAKGSPRVSGWCHTGELFDLTPELPADGTYILQLDNTFLTDLSATVSLHKTLPTVSVPNRGDGTPVTLTTTGAGQTAKTDFYLDAGEHALITCEQLTESPKWTQTWLNLPPEQYRPAEGRVCAHAPSEAGRIVMDTEWSWMEGPHSFEVDPKDANTGTFDVRVYKVRDPQAGVWGWDRPFSVTTTKPGENAKFVFWADEGDVISGTCQVASGAARTTVYGPAGEVVATGNCATGMMPATTLPGTGNYRAVVDWPGLGTNTATATFHKN
ncbi:hypothetical protein Lesp02_31570 [Lentzea sp. NBRC 105346]|uniref:hypothetical protein n=1 Tax=Lentzea sp. NBRC 105346 TaxID=3032205 RepID=UPI0024A5CD3B|nr:hypothetical protein [Lentzea sp. NBRC 105346]GLZ30968.1 hypothetical protein Lesp02_31570 [Lentzea sp. NBRC 105346]